MVGLAAFDVNEAVRPANDAGEKRQRILEIAVEADEGLQDAGAESGAGGRAGGGVDTVSWRGDGNAFSVFFGSELEVELVGLFSVKCDVFVEYLETREKDGDFVFAREDTHEGILAKVVGDGGEFFAGGKIFESDFRVWPDGLDLIGADGENDAGELRGFGREDERRNCKEEGAEAQNAGKPEWCGANPVEHEKPGRGGRLRD